ncbi:recombinase family protein [Cereibacter johrii]|uniref:recombinase family protein n=1 Tax=Cereibacter johrii TaxID=445629 RepID=UPI000DCE64FD|nr:recombinase family protein [Cereibacter johrii]RAZ81655.1 hypothetical protein DDV93_22460 [Cereibacter johrii]
MPASPRRVIIYSRYSSDLQNPRSVADRIAMCRREAESRGWSVIDIRSDEGLTGSRDDQLGFRLSLRRRCCAG